MTFFLILCYRQWNSIEDTVKAETKAFILNFLFEKAPYQGDRDVAKVLRSYTRLLNFIVKQQWFDGPSFQDITQVVEQAMERDQASWLIGLKIFVDLVEVMQPELNNLSRSRRIAVSFREVSLKEIFTRVYALLKEVAHGQKQLSSTQDVELLNMLLKVATQTLSFDFLGTLPEDTTDEVMTVMLPTSWEIMKDEEMPNVFFKLYNIACGPSINSEIAAVNAMQFLTLLGALRRSYFSTETERFRLIGSLIDISRHIVMEPNQGLCGWRRWPKVYHELCKFLSKINTSNKLRELYEIPVFQQWIDAVFNLTMQALPHWHQQPQSQHYLIQFWSSFVAPVSFASELDVSGLKEALTQIAVAFVQGQISLADAVGRGDTSSDEDPMGDETTRNTQLESLVVFSKHKLLPMAELLGQSFESAALEIGQFGIANGGVLKRITWLLYAIGSIVGGHANSSSSSSSTDEMHSSSDDRTKLSTQVIISKLCGPVLQFIQAVDASPDTSCEEQFELAVLYFLENFRKVHFGEQASAQSQSRLSTMSSPSSSPSMSALHTPQQQESVSDLLGLPAGLTILDIIVQKLIRNLSRASTTEEVGKATVSTLFGMCNGVSIVTAKYASMRILVAYEVMLKTESVKVLLGNHHSPDLQFLQNPKFSKYRTRYYHALGRLLFCRMKSVSSDEKSDFVLFMRPFEEAIAALQRNSITDPNVARRTIISIFRDLRGLSMAALVSEHYNLLFDWLVNIPNKPDACRLSLVTSSIKTFWGDHEVSVPLLKFMSEFTQQKGSGRISFPANSMNGFVLFHHVTHCLSTFGQNTIERLSFRDVYRQKYKPTAVALEMFCNAQSGDYVNTGVFAWYGDSALSQAVVLGLRLALEIPTSDLTSYGASLRSIYQFIQSVAKSHCKFFFQLPNTHLQRLLSVLEEGYMSFDTNTKTQSCSALAAFITYCWKESRPPPPNEPAKSDEDQNIQRACLQYLNTEHTRLRKTLFTLLHLCLFEANHSNWSLSRPMLPLILLFPDELTSIKNHIRDRQTPATAEIVENTFKELMEGVSDDMSDKNCDHFTKNLYLFSTGLKSRITQ